MEDKVLNLFIHQVPLDHIGLAILPILGANPITDFTLCLFLVVGGDDDGGGIGTSTATETE